MNGIKPIGQFHPSDLCKNMNEEQPKELFEPMLCFGMEHCQKEIGEYKSIIDGYKELNAQLLVEKSQLVKVVHDLQMEFVNNGLRVGIVRTIKE